MNLEFAERVVKHIRNNPEQHDQYFWFIEDDDSPCGTTACIAGWTCLLNGDTIDNSHDYAIDQNGVKRDIVDRAGQLLGISYSEANEIFFNMENDEALGMLESMIDQARMNH